MTTIFDLTPRQKEVRKLLGGPQTHSLLFGGSRSGKTFIIEYAKAVRAIRSPNSRHLMARHQNIDVRQSVLQDTFPKMMRLAFPNVAYSVNKQDQYVQLPNGSELWYAGLDDKERVEKILGKEYATIAVNEASQVKYDTIETLRTRLAQKCFTDSGVELPLRAYYDLNPSGSSHWTYQEFIKSLKPNGEIVADPEDYAYAVMNPGDNPHLPEAYLKQLAGLSSLQRKRFLHGEYLTDMPGALWTRDMLNDARSKSIGGDRRRVVVGVDPSGGAGERGIVVACKEGDNDYAILQDASGIMSAEEYGRRAAAMADKYDADAIAVERNYGGDMAKAIIDGFEPRARVIMVTASRGKHVRAEPISALYEKNRVRHDGVFQELEDQMTQITANGWEGEGKSPDRLDAAVWALTELSGDESVSAAVFLPKRLRR